MNSNVEYQTNEQKGVVVCKIWDCKDLAIKRIEKHRPLKVAEFADRYKVDDVFVGVAKCSDLDKFDIENGKKLAMKRAISKRSAAINEKIERYIRDVESALGELRGHEIRNE